MQSETEQNLILWLNLLTNSKKKIDKLAKNIPLEIKKAYGLIDENDFHPKKGFPRFFALNKNVISDIERFNKFLDEALKKSMKEKCPDERRKMKKPQMVAKRLEEKPPGQIIWIEESRGEKGQVEEDPVIIDEFHS